VKIEFFLLNFNGIWNFLPIFLLMIFENSHRVDLRGGQIFSSKPHRQITEFFPGQNYFFFQNFSKFIFANFLVVFHNGGNLFSLFWNLQNMFCFVFQVEF
jgi:hypothetical protein